MKVTNKSFIKRVIIVLAVVSIISGGMALVDSFLPNRVAIEVTFYLLLFVFAGSVLIYTQLRYIEFDSSGEVLVLKSYHPLKNGMHLHRIRAVELPKQMIKKHFIKKGFLYKELILLIENETDQKSIKITFNLSQMPINTINNIHLELEKLLK